MRLKLWAKDEVAAFYLWTHCYTQCVTAISVTGRTMTQRRFREFVKSGATSNADLII